MFCFVERGMTHWFTINVLLNIWLLGILLLHVKQLFGAFIPRSVGKFI